MGYNEKELLNKAEQEKTEKQEIVLPPKKETIGEILKNKRESSGKTIEYISNYLRIKPQYLKALEEDKFNLLPGKAYAIGFIKSYANFLELDTDLIIAQYKKENSHLIENITNTSDENTIIEDPIINSNHIIIIGVIVFIGILGAYFVSNKKETSEQIQVISEETQEKIEQNVSDTTITKDPDTENIDIVMNTPQTANTILQTAEAIPEMNQNIEFVEFVNNESNVENVDLTDSINDENINANIEEEIKIVPNQIPNQEGTNAILNDNNIVNPTNLSIENMNMEEETGNEYGIENKNTSRIKLHAKDRSWVKLKKDGLYKYDSEEGDIGSGSTIFETILEAGDYYYVPNEEDLYLTIGNSAGIEFIIDGKEIIPSLSNKKISRLNVEMNVEKLKNGTAYIRNRELYE